jgi:hypothetical protein
VFTTGWGDPVHPDTLSSLFPILIKRYNEAHEDHPLPHARLHDPRDPCRQVTTGFTPTRWRLGSPLPDDISLHLTFDLKSKPGTHTDRTTW